MGSGDVFVPPVVLRSTNYIGQSYWNEGRFEGDISEVLVYDRALTSAEQADVVNYLNAKYFGVEPEPEPEVPLVPSGVLLVLLVMRRCRWSGMVLLVPMGIGCIARRRVVRCRWWLRLRCRGLSMLRW